jgi:rhodanese-related sulfurtransferase
MTPEVAYAAAQAGEIFLIDIRRPDEWLDTRVGEGAIGLDMRDDGFVPMLIALREANPDKPIALICATGMRSGYVTSALAKVPGWRLSWK